MLTSSFTLQNGTLITSLLIFYFKLVLVCTKRNRFIEYTPRKCFNSFVQSAVVARRQGDANFNSGVVAETIKLLAISFCSYQSLDRFRHTVIKYLNDENTYAANISNFFKQLNHAKRSFIEVDLTKTDIEHKEPIIVGFFYPLKTQNS